MKIDSVYISAFGKFEDKKFDFNDGLNLIYGENEDGKTTLITFIRMMFYGTVGKSTEEIYKNPRKKYAPRNDKPMAGSIDFESGGKKYRIERIFKATNATDKIAVTDLGSGERETFTGKEDLGKRFLGISLEAAERTVFLSEHGAHAKNGSAEGELNSRLSNLAGTGNEEFSAEEILGRLEKAKTSLITKTGRGGKISRDTDKLAELKSQLEKAKRTEQERKECDLRLQNEKARLSSIQTEIDRLTAHIKAAEGGKRYAKLKEYCDDCAALESVNKKLITEDGGMITVSAVNDAENKLNEYKLLSENLPALKEITEKLEAEVEELKLKLDMAESSEEIGKTLKDNTANFEIISGELEKLETEAAELSKQVLMAKMEKPKIRPVFPVFALISLLICAASFIVEPFKNILLAGGAILTLIFIILTFAIRKKSKLDPIELERKEQDMRAAIDKKQKESVNLTLLINGLTAKEAVARQKEVAAGESFTAKYEQFKVRSEELNTLITRMEKIEETLAPFVTSKQKEFSPKGMEIILYSHKTNLQKKENYEVRIAILKKDLDGISPIDAQKELSVIPEGAISVGDPDDLNERLIFKKKEYESLQQTIADDTAGQKNDFRFSKHPTELEHEIEELEKLIAKEYGFCESVDIAYSTLNDAFAKVRETFGSALSDRTSDIFSGLTKGKYSSVSISKSFNIAVEEKDIFGTNDWQTLSDGTIDQAYFALRLTVSELLSNDGEKLPLILDDPFDRYDDGRAKLAMEFLKEYSKESQTLFFTCHKLFTETGPFITLQ